MGKFFGSNDDGGVAADDDGCDQETRPSSEGSSGAGDNDNARRFGRGEVEMGAGDGVHRAEHLRIFIGPAGEMHEAIDGSGDFAAGLAAVAPVERAISWTSSGARFCNISAAR